MSAILKFSQPGENQPLEEILRQLRESPELRLWFLGELLGEPACRQLGIYALPKDFKVSVVIPVYNERTRVDQVLRRVPAVAVPKEIILVDDASTEGTRELLQSLEGEDLKIIYHPANRGKGAALRTGFQQADGHVIIVQDADLEYDPADYPKLLQPIIEGRADVVFGSRFLGPSHRLLYFWHYVANKLLTTVSNIFTNLNLSDMETCYKVFRREVLDGINLKSDRFGFEPEFTAKIAKKVPALRIYEVPISYAGRTYEEGKKIGPKDAFQALYTIFRYWLAD